MIIFETVEQENIVKAMRSSQKECGFEISDLMMFRPKGHYCKVPTWVCDMSNGKQKVYSINAVGYNVYI
jgi:hypothetical protein